MAETAEKHKEKIELRLIEDEMKQSYLAYSMSVIVGRALPDVRDGLKPVHRRILYSMWESGLLSNKPFKKSATVVGNVLGRYHPHGDTAVYDSMVRMVQDFSLRYPLVHGQGNFGCFTGDTKIALTDGRNISFKELIEENKNGKQNFCYTIKEDGNLDIEEIKNPRITKKNAEIIKIVLRNGKEIECTPDHRFMLKNRIYKQAQHLILSDEIMAYSENIASQNVQLLITTQTIQKIIKLNKYADVYDIEVPHTHNFSLAAGVFVHNSVDGDNAAAYRYTEAKLKKIAEDMLQDIDKETVLFVPNFDGSLQEPTVLPSKVPNLLINGSSGIAVGMATNIPPHNMKEVCAGVCRYIDNPHLSALELAESVKGPDFPTGGIICGDSGIIQAYKYGRGKVTIRSKVSVEEGKKQKIIVHEIPYQVNKSLLIEQIADCVKDKIISGVSDIRDESDRDGMRIVIELKQDIPAEVVLNQLYKHTRLQTSYGIIFLSLVDNQPLILNLKEMIKYFVEHRQVVVRKRTEFDLRKAEERAHLLEGLVIALDHIDPVIKLIKESKSTETAREGLTAHYKLTEKQAQAILDMKLQRLTGLERDKIREEHKNLLTMIVELKDILAKEKRILDIIKSELKEMAEKYGDARKTFIEKGGDDTILEDEDLIKEEDMVVTVTHAGYVKRLPLDTYKTQRRGGQGVKGATTKEEDFVKWLFVANTHAYLLVFTNLGRVHWIKVHQLPEASRTARGNNIVNYVQLQQGESIAGFVTVKEFKEDHYLFFATKQGTVKKTDLTSFSNPRKGGIQAVGLNDNDQLVQVLLTDGKQQILLATANGNAVRFEESDVRPMGRTAAGVRGVKLKGDDVVIDTVIADDTKTLLSITENGYGKRTEVTEYRLINRGGSGVINIQTDERNGKVVSIASVRDTDDVMVISQKGIMIRTPCKDISVIGRNTKGVRLMRMKEGDHVMATAKIEENEEETITFETVTPPKNDKEDYL